MVAAIGDALGTVIDWVGTVVTSLTDATNGELYALLPLLAIGIAVSALLLGELIAEFKSVKKSGILECKSEVKA